MAKLSNADVKRYVSFIEGAYKVNQESSPYKGLHTVWSGFNTAFRRHFGETPDVVEIINALKASGHITVVPAKGGAKIYLGDDVPDDKANKLLAGMGL